jgi:hypothetical protein
VFDYETVHWIMATCFIVFVAISELIHTAEFGCLNRAYGNYNRLRKSYLIKLAFVIAELVVIIIYVSSYNFAPDCREYLLPKVLNLPPRYVNGLLRYISVTDRLIVTSSFSASMFSQWYMICVPTVERIQQNIILLSKMEPLWES